MEASNDKLLNQIDELNDRIGKLYNEIGLLARDKRIILEFAGIHPEMEPRQIVQLIISNYPEKFLAIRYISVILNCELDEAVEYYEKEASGAEG